MFFLFKMSIEPFIKTLFLLLITLLNFKNKKVPEMFGSFGNNSYLCGIACKPLGVKAGGLIYEKDVFERLSL